MIAEILRTKPHDGRQLARYVKFIETRTPKSGPIEKHHICPRAKDLFPEYGSFYDHPWNRIDLTPREHYVAHLLLWKTYGGSQTRAIKMMTLRGSKFYESVKQNVVEQLKVYRHSEETKAKISKSKTGKPRRNTKPMSEEAKAKISAARKLMIGKPFSEERKAKISATMKLRGISPQIRKKTPEGA